MPSHLELHRAFLCSKHRDRLHARIISTIKDELKDDITSNHHLGYGWDLEMFVGNAYAYDAHSRRNKKKKTEDETFLDDRQISCALLETKAACVKKERDPSIVLTVMAQERPVLFMQLPKESELLLA